MWTDKKHHIISLGFVEWYLKFDEISVLNLKCNIINALLLTLWDAIKLTLPVCLNDSLNIY